ncbi:MAG: sigma-70 family RNA polymerase sigma factor [Bryobacterales bacterium]|nr:sigma-70 family RNA polymerase sigma factor [Bryobacterales bacterium]MBV9400327.1 sigma-70 family RNA polymerase sigma factor [Bryobacterales bacterium]
MIRPLPEDEVVLMYRQTIRPLYAYVSRRVGRDQSLAEDLVQEAWMRALDDWSAKGLPEEPLAWLLRVAHNILMSHFRRIRLQQLDPAVIDLAAEDPALGPTNAEAAAAIGWGMAQLRRADADVLEAFYFDGRSVREIAAEHSISERAVEGRLRRAREKLKKKLKKKLGPTAFRAQQGEGATPNVRSTRAQ